ncbi:hypothetical protein RFI_07047 [Reticulomyxa filosa]|uniref:Uncharacterized protein n=1 Tax=Reticulomyxa filosa TaxID=46433 RepID=X6NW70_RETFI|nr:hypothetical protein RFI_07047 [Reticulomyxa filosa]|eukprot:ETO30074.1 hypothetical protein RFI_07047 [Reticulomyxa filosa]
MLLKKKKKNQKHSQFRTNTWKQDKSGLKDAHSQQTLFQVKKGLLDIRKQVEKRETEAESIKTKLTRQLSELRAELEQIEKNKIKTESTIRNLQKGTKN